MSKGRFDADFGISVYSPTGLDDKMKVIGNQAPPQHPHRQPGRCRRDQFENRLISGCVMKHLGSPVATVQDMIAVIARRGSRSSWRDVILRAKCGVSQPKSRMSPRLFGTKFAH
jgi:hypothetical protein